MTSDISKLFSHNVSNRQATYIFFVKFKLFNHFNSYTLLNICLQDNGFKVNLNEQCRSNTKCPQKNHTNSILNNVCKFSIFSNASHMSDNPYHFIISMLRCAAHTGISLLIFYNNKVTVLRDESAWFFCGHLHNRWEWKVKLSHYMPWRHMGGDEVRRHSSYSYLTSALDGGEWSVSRPGRALPPGKGSAVPIG
jgi:hypothetical protein